MTDAVAIANIDINVNVRSISEQMQKVRQSVTQNGSLLEKNMLRNFMGITNAAKRMATQVQFALKAFTIPGMLVSGIAVKKLFSSDSEAGRLVKSQFEDVNKSINESIVRIGYFITQSKIFGKTMLEWLKAFADLLNRVTQRDVQIFVNMLSKALVTIVAIGAAIKAINFSQGFMKALSMLGTTSIGSTVRSGIGSLIGAGLGGLAGGAGAAGASKVGSGVLDMIKRAEKKAWTGKDFGAVLPKDYKKSQDLFLRSLDVTSATTSVASVSKMTNILKWGKIVVGGITKLSLIFGGIYLAFEFISGIFKNMPDIGFFKGVGNAIMKAFSWIGMFLSSVAETVNFLGRQTVNVLRRPDYGSARSKRITDETEAYVDRMREIQNPTKGKAPSTVDNSKEIADFVEEQIKIMEDMGDKAASSMKDFGDNALKSFTDASDKIVKDLDDRLDKEKIIKDVTADRLKLEKEIYGYNSDAMDKIKKEKDSLERERMSYSGQFVGGTELNKFQQRFQTEWTNKLIDSNNNIAEISRQSDEKLKEANTELKTLNDKFDKFIQAIEAGAYVDVAGMAEGIGL